jgi:restriction system protein
MTDTGLTKVPPAWLIRAGKYGERDDFAIENGLSGGGWDDIPDLTNVVGRHDLEGIVRDAWPDAKKGAVANYAGQLWMLRGRVRSGDLVVLPLKTTSQIALGVVEKEYWYREDPDPSRRHVVSVDWRQISVPRTAVKQDLLYSLGSALTICSITRNDGAWRLQQILQTGHDPGARSQVDGLVDDDDDTVTDSPESGIDLERVGRDRIQTFLAEHFAGHQLSRLVAEVLETEGFMTLVAPPGPDGGIDVFAGRGPLGLDSPRLIVQVKSSPSPVDVKVVRELNGVLSAQNADQGLLVAWGGVTKPARQEMRNQFFRVRVWDADQLINAALRNYHNLSDELRADLPLKRVWTLVED